MFKDIALCLRSAITVYYQHFSHHYTPNKDIHNKKEIITPLVNSPLIKDINNNKKIFTALVISPLIKDINNKKKIFTPLVISPLSKDKY